MTDLTSRVRTYLDHIGWPPVWLTARRLARATGLSPRLVDSATPARLDCLTPREDVVRGPLGPGEVRVRPQDEVIDLADGARARRLDELLPGATAYCLASPHHDGYELLLIAGDNDAWRVAVWLYDVTMVLPCDLPELIERMRPRSTAPLRRAGRRSVGDLARPLLLWNRTDADLLVVDALDATWGEALRLATSAHDASAWWRLLDLCDQEDFDDEALDTLSRVLDETWPDESRICPSDALQRHLDEGTPFPVSWRLTRTLDLSFSHERRARDAHDAQLLRVLTDGTFDGLTQLRIVGADAQDPAVWSALCQSPLPRQLEVLHLSSAMVPDDESGPTPGAWSRLRELSTALPVDVLRLHGLLTPRLETLEIRGVRDGRQLALLAQSPCTPSTLDIAMNPTLDVEGQLEAFARSSLLSRCRTLCIRNVDLTSVALRTLFLGRHAAQVERLELRFIRGDASSIVSSLVEHAGGGRLHTLACRLDLDASQLRLLADTFSSQLRELDLDGSRLDDDACTSLFEHHDWARLESLSLRRLTPGRGGLSAFTRAASAMPLHALDLSHVRLDQRATRTLAASPLAHTVRVLRLGWTGLDVVSLRDLVSAFTHLTTLDLTGNDLGVEGARVLAESPALITLDQLWLRPRDLGGDAGLRILTGSRCLARRVRSRYERLLASERHQQARGAS